MEVLDVFRRSSVWPFEVTRMMKPASTLLSWTRVLLQARPAVIALVGLALLGAQAAFAQNSRPGHAPPTRGALPPDVTLRKSGSTDAALGDFLRQTDQALSQARTSRRSR